MSHATADLEYFKCDVCGVYLHRDIFCDHRRECKGRDSTELRKSECRQLQDLLSRETWLLVAEQDKLRGAALRAADGGSRSSNAEGDGQEAEAGQTHVMPGNRAVLLTAEQERRQDARVRRRVADAYQAKLSAKVKARLSEERCKQLLESLLE